MEKQEIYDDVSMGMDGLRADFQRKKLRRLFLVHGNTYYGSTWKKWLDTLPLEVVHFTEFTPNPSFDSVVKGIQILKKENCDGILAIGGGSAIDVAKCVKVFATLSEEKSYFEQIIVENQIPLYAIPTTAGTGSESTCFAVIYVDGEKKSIEHTSCLPGITVLDTDWLVNIPILQKKATLLDALSHSIESYWSVNATEDSQKIAAQSIRLIVENYQAYLWHYTEDVGRKIFRAANLAGQAINMTRTTAGHAMCYKLTTLFHLPHGMAVAECLPKLWQYMVEHLSQCTDPRGISYLKKIFGELNLLLQESQEESQETNVANQPQKELEDWQQGAASLERIVNRIGLAEMPLVTDEQLEELVQAVNLERLKNNPIKLAEENIRHIYREISNITD